MFCCEAFAVGTSVFILLVYLCMYLYNINSYLIFVRIFSYCVHQ